MVSIYFQETRRDIESLGRLYDRIVRATLKVSYARSRLPSPSDRSLAR